MKSKIALVLGFTIATTAQAYTKDLRVRQDLKIKHCHYTATQNPFDIALINKGFFVVQRGQSPTAVYTRLGKLALDSSGYLLCISAPGMGYILGSYANSTQSNGELISGAQRIQIPSEPIPAKPTSFFQLDLNLDAHVIVNTEFTWNGEVYNQQGEMHPLMLRFRRMDDFRWYVDFMIDNAFSGSHELAFAPTGELQPYSAFANIQWYSPQGMQPINFDFTSTTQYAAPFSVQKMNTDGHSKAYLMYVDINQDGDIVLLYDNGSYVKWASLAVATFDNPKKLRNIVDEIYEQTPASGFGDIQPVNSYGAFLSGYLELKNCVVKKKRKIDPIS